MKVCHENQHLTENNFCIKAVITLITFSSDFLCQEKKNQNSKKHS